MKVLRGTLLNTPHKGGAYVTHEDALAAIEQARREVLDEVLRGLRSERDTDQLRAIIASVEYIRTRGEGK